MRLSLLGREPLSIREMRRALFAKATGKFHFLTGRIRNGEVDLGRWTGLSLTANQIETQKFVDARIEHG